MEIDNLPDHIVYSPQVIDFVTVAAETCLFLEHATDLSREEFVSKGAKILALLYLKTAVLEIPERVYEDMTERFVSEEDYNDVKGQLELLLGEKDSYLETFHPDMSLSDTPIVNWLTIAVPLRRHGVSIKDVTLTELPFPLMNDALVTCLETFGEHWGQKALNALRALHNIRYSGGVGIESQGDPELPTGKLDKNTFLGYLREDGEDVNPYL